MAQLLSNLPIGATIKFGKHQVGSETAQPIIWVVAAKNHSGYPSNSVTLVAQKIIDIRAYDATEANYAGGNGDYGLSNINQWLNSSASAGGWYTATHTNDTPPTNDSTEGETGYQDRAGFLYNFTTAERELILPTTLTVQIGTNISKKFTSKVYLPSLWEILGTGETFDGSSCFEYFQPQGGGCPLTSQAFTYTSSTNKPDAIADNFDYWTRSTHGNQPCTISYADNFWWQHPYYGDGIRPVLNLPAKAKISDTPDSSGCYTWSANKVPTISGSNSDLGNKSDDFSTAYTISDGDSESITVTEYIDNVAIRSYVATLGSTNTFAVNGVTWLKLANGIHTLKIVATDGFDTVTRTHTFTKVTNKLIVKRKTPIASTARPSKIIVTLVKNIPENALVTVEVCNNGFDASPKWETIPSSSITAGVPYDFTNTTKTASKWGVNIRVTVDRNGASGACYITEIGGNFE